MTVTMIDVWIADVGQPGWRSLTGASEKEPEVQSAVGRALDRWIRRRGARRTSISHSGRHVVVAEADPRHVEAIGIDIEVRRPVPRCGAFSRRILATGEPPPGDLLAAWTVKEAVLKATGVGLRGDPRAWCFGGLASDRPWLERAPQGCGPPERWSFAAIEVCEPEAARLSVAALLAQTGHLRLCLRPITASRLDGGDRAGSQLEDRQTLNFRVAATPT